MRLIIGAVLAATIVGVIAFLSASPGGSDGGGSARTPPAGTTAYSAEAFSTVAPTETVVFFFSAPWCSTCSALRADIDANAAEIPEDLRIFIVDFDDETALKQTYGVARQHTLVHVDSSGAVIDRWESSRTLDDVLRSAGVG